LRSPDIKKVEVSNDYKLLLTFANGEIKLFDIKPYLKYPVFKPLQQKHEFENYTIVDGTIEWKCGADLSTDTFYLEGESISNGYRKEM